MQEQRSLLECILVTKVPEELKEAHISWQVALTDAPKHPQVGLKQRKLFCRKFSSEVI
jgi:hypothetical protein